MNFEFFVTPSDHPSQRAVFFTDAVPYCKTVDVGPPMNNRNAVPPAIAHECPLRYERIIRADDQLRFVLTQVPDQRPGVQYILPLAFEVILLVDRLADSDWFNRQRLQLGIRRQSTARRRQLITIA